MSIYVSELCKKKTGESFFSLKLQYQLEHAENLLIHTRLGIDEIAEQSGFSGQTTLFDASNKCTAKHHTSIATASKHRKGNCYKNLGKTTTE